MKKSWKLLITVALTFLLIGFILPAFLPYRPPMKIVCSGNIKQVSICCRVYHMDTQTWPNAEKWSDLLKPFFADYERNIWRCPTDNTGPCSYAMNANIPDGATDLPPDLVLLFESAPGWNRTGGPADVITDRHGKHRPGANIAFADGRVEFVRAEDIPALRWTVETATGPLSGRETPKELNMSSPR